MVTADKLERYLARQPEPDGDDSPRFLREVAYERLKDAITHADLRPGEPLSETRLSKMLGISRTPVREALRQLAQEGLVQIIPGRAVTVAVPSVQEVLNVVHVRSLLEPEVARLAAESLSPTDIEILQNIVTEMEQAAEAGDRPTWSKADTRFHEILSHNCPNELLGQMVLQMRNRVHYIAIDPQTTHARMIECTREHRRIVEAIAARDSLAAEQTTSEHISQLRGEPFQSLDAQSLIWAQSIPMFS